MRTLLVECFVVLSMLGVASIVYAEDAPNKGATATDTSGGAETSAPLAPGETLTITVDSILAEPPRARAPTPAVNALPISAPEEIKGVRVPYIPEIVKQEIRNQIRAELRQDVVQDVLTQAKEERWGVPGVLPEWIDRIKIKGDLRLRAQVEAYDSDNFPYYDFLAVNRAGGFLKFQGAQTAFLNTTEERERLRERIRIAVDAKVTTEVKAMVRLSTGSSTDPVSTNQTLGNTANRYAVLFDQAYLQFDDMNTDRYPYLTLWGGRIANPWLSTDLVWDTDLAFEGIAATYRYNLRGSESLMEMNERDRTLFVTAGAFPIQEVALSPQDKWLYGAQLGAEFIFTSQSTLTFGLAYYDFVHITGKFNAVESYTYDYTAPDFMQKGNTLFDIRSSFDSTLNRLALASDYNLVNFTFVYDIARFAPHHVVVTGDYVKNIGYKRADIVKRIGGYDYATNPIDARTVGYQLQLAVGWPLVLERGKWRTSLAYKYLQRDAVLDAFTDSDFHLGGTDAKGWIVGGEYALTDNTWLSVRYLTADAIDGPPLGIDIFQMDLNAKF